MFDMKSDPAFEFADPVMARLIRDVEAAREEGLFDDLLFRRGEERGTAREERAFDG